MTIPIYLPGAAGRMGRAIAERIAANPRLRLAGAFEAKGHEWIGRAAGDVLPLVSDALIRDNPPEKVEAGAVGIHFTTPEATLEWLEWSARHRAAMVIGTTGFAPAQLDRIRKSAASLPIVLAPNMSVGVNLLFAVTQRAAKTLKDDFDVEVSEIHHNQKKDAPSGTAVRLHEILAEELGLDVEANAVHGRKGLVGARPKREIGVHALRGGDVVGEHTVYFFGNGERVEFTHRATSRSTFAQGAIRAAEFAAAAPAGLYDMQDVLGLK